MGAALFDSLSAAFMAFSDRWAHHFPEANKLLEENGETSK